MLSRRYLIVLWASDFCFPHLTSSWKHNERLWAALNAQNTDLRQKQLLLNIQSNLRFLLLGDMLYLQNLIG